MFWWHTLSNLPMLLPEPEHFLWVSKSLVPQGFKDIQMAGYDGMVNGARLLPKDETLAASLFAAEASTGVSSSTQISKVPKKARLFNGEFFGVYRQRWQDTIMICLPLGSSIYVQMRLRWAKIHVSDGRPWLNLLVSLPRRKFWRGSFRMGWLQSAYLAFCLQGWCPFWAEAVVYHCDPEQQELWCIRTVCG